MSPPNAAPLAGREGKGWSLCLKYWALKPLRAIGGLGETER